LPALFRLDAAAADQLVAALEIAADGRRERLGAAADDGEPGGLELLRPFALPRLRD